MEEPLNLNIQLTLYYKNWFFNRISCIKGTKCHKSSTKNNSGNVGGVHSELPSSIKRQSPESGFSELKDFQDYTFIQ